METKLQETKLALALKEKDLCIQEIDLLPDEEVRQIADAIENLLKNYI